MAADELAARLGLWASGPGPLYRQLADALARLIRSGVLRGGARLPAERTLAACLSLSRGTVVAAYDALRDAGDVTRVQGQGTTVRAGAAAIDPAHQRPVGDALFQGSPASIDLLMAVPDVLPEVLELVRGVDLGADPAVLNSSEPAGIPALRGAIAGRMTAEGLPTTAEQILVTSGAQQGIALLTALLARPGDVVLTEEVTWPGLGDSIRRAGARVVGVPMDEHGVVVDELVALVERFRPVFIALNPHHQNPTGSRLSAARRQQVAELAAAYRVPLIEDRVATPLAFDGNVPPPLAVHQTPATSIVVDSINKSAWAGLRVGWVRADVQLVSDLRSSRALADLFSPIPTQLMALAALEHLDQIHRARIDQLSRRAATLREEMTRQLPDWELAPIRGGMVAWAKVPHGSAAHVTRLAARHGVAVATGASFGTGNDPDDHIRLPFTAAEPVLREAVTRLASAWAELGGSAATDDPMVAAIV